MPTWRFGKYHRHTDIKFLIFGPTALFPKLLASPVQSNGHFHARPCEERSTAFFFLSPWKEREEGGWLRRGEERRGRRRHCYRSDALTVRAVEKKEGKKDRKEGRKEALSISLLFFPGMKSNLREISSIREESEGEREGGGGRGRYLRGGGGGGDLWHHRIAESTSRGKKSFGVMQ